MGAKSKVPRGRTPAPGDASKRARRPASEHAGPGGEREVLARLARELLGVCSTALRRFEADPGRQAVNALRGFPRSARYAAQMLEDADKLGQIHTQWRLKTGYFDEDGRPKTLSISGRAPSYEALCADFGLVDEWERLLGLALTLRMCSRVGSERLAFLSEITLFTGMPSLLLARVVLNIERLLKTTAFNAKRGRELSQSLADRSALAELSAEEFQQFATAMRGILHDFIESADRRLLAGVARDDLQPKKHSRRRVSGVTAYLFRD